MSLETTTEEGQKPLPSKTEEERDEAAEQMLMLSDFDRVTKLFRAALQALGNENTGAIVMLKGLLSRAESLDEQTKKDIVPILGDLKALLVTSQDELKNFNKSAQEALETQIKDIINKVDFSPIQKKVEVTNTKILESTNAFTTKMEEIEAIANRTKRLGFFASLKFVVLGFGAAAGFLFALYQYNTSQFEEKIKVEFDAKIQAMETRTAVWKNLKEDQWGASIVEINGLKHIQLVVRDNSSQINLGRSFTTPDAKGQKHPVTFVNIPIFK